MLGNLLDTGGVDAETLLTKVIEYLKTTKFWLSLAILVVAVILWQVFKHARKQYFAKKGADSSTASHVAFDIARFVFVFVIIIVLMQLNGVNVTALVTGLGIFSVIIGLALQDFLKDIIMGAHILSDKFFQVGDVIRYNGIEGEVISFNIRTTKIRLVQYDEVMTISNRNISEITVLSNFFDLDVNIPYHISAEKVHPVMQDLADEVAKLDKVDQAIYKGTSSFNESSISYKLRYWTSPKKSRFDVARAVNMVVQDGLNKAGIPFAYHHLDVELVNYSKDKKES